MTPGRLDQNEFEFVDERGGFVLVASSITNPDERERWLRWLAGWENVNRTNRVSQPRTSRAYLRAGENAAVVLREQTGEDSRRGMRVSVLIGRSGDLTARFAARIARWPDGRPWPPARGGEEVARLPPRGPADYGVRRPDQQTDVAWHGELRVTSPAPDLGEVLLQDPLAVTLAAVLRQRADEAAGQGRQVVLVGADEPTATALVVALTGLLSYVGDDPRWPTFSTFEATYPRVAAHPHDPKMIFMPDRVEPERGFDRPVAYVYLAPALCGEGQQPYVAHRAAGPDPFARIARAVIRAGTIGLSEGQWRAFPVLADRWLQRPADWAAQVDAWAASHGVPPPPGPGEPAPHFSSDPPPSVLPPSVPPTTMPPPPDRSTDPRSGPSKPDSGTGAPPRTPHDAEELLRRAIRNFPDAGPFPRSMHTVDAFIQLARTRQWLNSNERNLVKAFLLRTFHWEQRPVTEAETGTAGSRSIRLPATEALAAVPLRQDLAANELVECLLEVLQLNADNRSGDLGRHLRRALELLVAFRPLPPAARDQPAATAPGPATRTSPSAAGVSPAAGWPTTSGDSAGSGNPASAVDPASSGDWAGSGNRVGSGDWAGSGNRVGSGDWARPAGTAGGLQHGSADQPSVQQDLPAAIETGASAYTAGPAQPAVVVPVGEPALRIDDVFVIHLQQLVAVAAETVRLRPPVEGLLMTASLLGTAAWLPSEAVTEVLRASVAHRDDEPLVAQDLDLERSWMQPIRAVPPAAGTDLDELQYTVWAELERLAGELRGLNRTPADQTPADQTPADQTVTDQTVTDWTYTDQAARD
ncbi:hypothetical protein CC117_28975 [Parafrankia colletiae]|uniref:Uncharacterized protein n=1 Tax=Parafrankia colletiae TaxID=573497 RepID=A0A1S1Q3W5_9ACTN|nr:hypothetical protein [Parafrankia colletiae]OHV29598.1 hypothetical protein CC117_28975 [Parafrankia colletiae]